jgi:23S rRNA pseudouridine955/2504/2580 synthase/23S rRNA pseudouridine1911/1915/1917 synthase
VSPKAGHPEIAILLRGAGYAAIGKPAGLAVVAERRRPGATPLLDAVAAALEVPEVLVVHRLDRDTSGAMLVAWEAAPHRALSLAFQRREVEKTYLALVRGEVAREDFEVDAPLEKDPQGGSRMRVARAGAGKRSLTRFRALERFRGFTLLEARPRTGRQHQIRVHLRHAGHPLAVDETYGGAAGLFLSELKRSYRPARDRPEAPLLGRVSLHALALAFRDPASGEPRRAECPPPHDFERALAALRRFGARGRDRPGGPGTER